MEILILCKVVDNFGDIGFVYRLARALSEIDRTLKLKIIVSDLNSFRKISGGTIQNIAFQLFNDWEIYDWNDYDFCYKRFKSNCPRFVIECFQCGRPDWLEEILFDEEKSEITNIINLEYLTAESWADDFHLLKSGTRSSLVKKINFMPGFTKKTGALILDKNFQKNKKDLNLAKKSLETYGFDTEVFGNENNFNVLIFTYPRNFEPFLSSLNDFEIEKRKTNPNFKVNIFAAPGLSFDSIKKLQEKYKNFSIIELPYMIQTDWDNLLLLSDFNFIRGEDSFSRACLAGKPFLWNAYVQSEEVQILKVNGFLERFSKHCSGENYRLIKNLHIYVNTYFSSDVCDEVNEILKDFDFDKMNEKKLFDEFFASYDSLKNDFDFFSKELAQNGDLAENLLHYINSLL